MLLEVKDIQVFYGDVQALWGASLSVGAGEVAALVGANGAGKSTMIKSISRVVPIARGSITFDGQQLKGLPPHRVVELGIVQVPEGRRLFPKMTVYENLLVGSHIPAARPHRAVNLKWVYSLFPKLEERADQLAGTLSGGEQQMVAIARGLMSRPRLLMLDEPSLGLAPLVVQEVFRVIMRLREAGITVLLVEQNTGHSLAIADRGFVMENGRVVLSGTGVALLANDHVKKAYLGA